MKGKLSVLLLIGIVCNSLSAQDDVMIITEKGLIGINKSNPKESLDVKGNINAEGKIKEKGNSLIPKGVIVMWSGSTTDVP